MKKTILVFLFCLGSLHLFAQDIYSSSGHSGYHKKTQKKGYDPDKLILGGGLNAGFGGGSANFGISPIVGYRFTDRFSSGIGLGYQYYKAPYSYDPSNNVQYYEYEHIIYPSVWSRYFIYKNVYACGVFEFDFTHLQEPLDNFGQPNITLTNITTPCLLLGIGIKQHLGGRLSGVMELMYDILDQKFSPYSGQPVIRFGLATGL